MRLEGAVNGLHYQIELDNWLETEGGRETERTTNLTVTVGGPFRLQTTGKWAGVIRIGCCEALISAYDANFDYKHDVTKEAHTDITMTVRKPEP